MGYQATICPESLEEYKGYENKTEELFANKMELLYKVMTDFKENVPFRTTFFNLSVLIEIRKNLLIADTKYWEYARWKEEEKHTLYYCGWEYSRLEDAPDIDDTIRYVTERLTMLHTLVKSGEYFSDESESNWYKKLNEVEDLINYLDDECKKSVYFELLIKYKDTNPYKEEEIKE